MTPWLLALCLARAADTTTTIYALQQPGLVEGVRWMPSAPAGQIAVQAATTAGQVYLLRRIAPSRPRLARWLVVAHVAISGTAAAWNLRQVRR